MRLDKILPFSPRAIRGWLVAILAVGLVIRLLHFWSITHSTWPTHHLMDTNSDPHSFYEWAQMIRAGDWLGRKTFHPYFDWMRATAPLETWYQWWGGREIFHQTPLYPYFLAAVLSLCKGSVSCVFLIQLCIGLIQPVVMYALAKRMFSSGAGLIAAALTAWYGPFVFYQAVLLRDWLPPIIEPLALLALVKAHQDNRDRDWVLAGVTLGVALLVRETILLYIVLAFGWVLLDSRRIPSLAVRRTGLLGAGLLLCLLPIIGRNIAVDAPPFALSSRSVEAVIFANAPAYDQRTLTGLLDESQGNWLSALSQTVDAYGGDWVRVLKRARWKVWLITDVFEYPNNVSLYYGKDISPILRWLPSYGLIFPLGLAGLLLLSGKGRDRGLCLLYGVATFTWLLVFSALSRYRLTLAPYLVLYAAGLIVYLTEKIRAAERRAVGWALMLVIVSIIVQHSLLRLPNSLRNYAFTADYLAAARAYAEQKRYDRATAEMAKLIDKMQESSERSTIPAYILADYQLFQAQGLLQRGLRAEARDALQQAVGTFSHSGQESTMAATYPWFNFGLLYLKLDEPAKAREALQKFVELDPTHPLVGRARNLLSRVGDPPVAEP